MFTESTKILGSREDVRDVTAVKLSHHWDPSSDALVRRRMLVTSSRLTVCSLFKELECAQNARVPAQMGKRRKIPPPGEVVKPINEGQPGFLRQIRALLRFAIANRGHSQIEPRRPQSSKLPGRSRSCSPGRSNIIHQDDGSPPEVPLKSAFRAPWTQLHPIERGTLPL